MTLLRGNDEAGRDSLGNEKRQQDRVVRTPDMKSASPALTAKLELFLGRPRFNSLVMLVDSQLVCLPPVGTFKPIMFS